VDDLKYDDQVKDEIKQVGLGKYDKINFISLINMRKPADSKDREMTALP
jgi:hypothetical protein